jgi:hypothetical protein
MEKLFLGYGADMQPLHVGDVVDHVEKGELKGGMITAGGEFYKNEPACRVDFPGASNWLARLSRLRLAPPKPKTVKDFGYAEGQKVYHVKYTHLNPLTITSEQVGEYKGEPCCFTGTNKRPTRFSQITPQVGLKEPEYGLKDLLKDLENISPDKEVFTTFAGGKKITLTIE